MGRKALGEVKGMGGVVACRKVEKEGWGRVRHVEWSRLGKVRKEGQWG